MGVGGVAAADRNGVFMATAQAPQTVNMNTLYNIGHNDNYFGGVIDDVRFYDRYVAIIQRAVAADLM